MKEFFTKNAKVLKIYAFISSVFASLIAAWITQKDTHSSSVAVEAKGNSTVIVGDGTTVNNTHNRNHSPLKTEAQPNGNDFTQRPKIQIAGKSSLIPNSIFVRKFRNLTPSKKDTEDYAESFQLGIDSAFSLYEHAQSDDVAMFDLEPSYRFDINREVYKPMNSYTTEKLVQANFQVLIKVQNRENGEMKVFEEMSSNNPFFISEDPNTENILKQSRFLFEKLERQVNEWCLSQTNL